MRLEENRLETQQEQIRDNGTGEDEAHETSDYQNKTGSN